MATCKAKLSQAKKLPAALFAATALSFLGTAAFAQTSAPQSPNAPAAPVTPVAPVQPVNVAPSVSMPSLPRISAPVSGGTFYTPGKRFLNNDAAAQDISAGDKQTKKSAASSELEKTLLGAAGTDFSGLTAQDLVQMAQSGSITNVSSLLGTSNFYNRANASGDNQVLLQKILSELTEIKKAQSQSLASSSTGTKPSTLPPKILRFVINANDVLSKCVQVYFSDTESDGSFLLTGDAKCLFENENISETFYLLFKASGTQNSKTVYTVTPTLSQSKKADTPLGKFCSAVNLTASRVGNLVTLHSLQDGTMADLLLDIGR
ncbi:MAG: hypothetical protein VZQ47_06275 [Treponema sp.]|nr:hypothetical protein [Treponema sp.]